MAIYSVDQVLEILIGWEKDLLDFYEFLEEQLKQDSSKHIVSMLKKEQAKAIGVLDDINIKDYQNLEYDKNLPNLKGENILPKYALDENSDPKEIIDKVFDFEEHLFTIFKHIENIVVYEKSKDVFGMLVQFKLGQIKKIKSYMDSI